MRDQCLTSAPFHLLVVIVVIIVSTRSIATKAPDFLGLLRNGNVEEGQNDKERPHIEETSVVAGLTLTFAASVVVVWSICFGCVFCGRHLFGWFSSNSSSSKLNEQTKSTKPEPGRRFSETWFESPIEKCQQNNKLISQLQRNYNSTGDRERFFQNSTTEEEKAIHFFTYEGNSMMSKNRSPADGCSVAAGKPQSSVPEKDHISTTVTKGDETADQPSSVIGQVKKGSVFVFPKKPIIRYIHLTTKSIDESPPATPPSSKLQQTNQSRMITTSAGRMKLTPKPSNLIRCPSDGKRSRTPASQSLERKEKTPNLVREGRSNSIFQKASESFTAVFSGKQSSQKSQEESDSDDIEDPQPNLFARKFRAMSLFAPPPTSPPPGAGPPLTPPSKLTKNRSENTINTHSLRQTGETIHQFHAETSREEFHQQQQQQHQQQQQQQQQQHQQQQQPHHSSSFKETHPKFQQQQQQQHEEKQTIFNRRNSSTSLFAPLASKLENLGSALNFGKASPSVSSGGAGPGSQFWVPPTVVVRKRAMSLAPDGASFDDSVATSAEQQASHQTEDTTADTSSSLPAPTSSSSSSTSRDVTLQSGVETGSTMTSSGSNLGWRRSRRASMQDALHSSMIDTSLYDTKGSRFKQLHDLTEEGPNSGSIHLTLCYAPEQNLLTVYLIGARDLPCEQHDHHHDLLPVVLSTFVRLRLVENEGRKGRRKSNTSLTGMRRHYMQTRNQCGGRNPRFDEEFLFELLPVTRSDQKFKDQRSSPEKQVREMGSDSEEKRKYFNQSLELLVFQWVDEQALEVCLGQTNVPLGQLQPGEYFTDTFWKELSPPVDAMQKNSADSNLELSFSLSYLRSAERMTVFVGQLKGFKSIKSVSSAYVRLTLYDNEKKLRRRKTTSTSITLLSSSLPAIVNCVWNESLQFDLSKDKLHSGMLTFELTVVGTEHSLLGTDSVIGSISLGPKTPLNSNFVKQNQTSKFEGVIAQDLPRGFQSESWCRTREDDDDDDDEDSLGGRNEPWWEVVMSDRHQSSVEFYPLQ